MDRDKLGFIFERRSCRNFTGEPLENGHIDVLLETMRWAPSGGNRQPWRFYVVKSDSMKKELGKAAFNQMFIADAPVVFVVCARPGESAAVYGERGENLYCVQDTAAAVENLMLAAGVLGYGSCWIGAFSEEAVSSAMDLEPELRPVAMVPVGKGSVGGETSRKPLEEVSSVIEAD